MCLGISHESGNYQNEPVFLNKNRSGGEAVIRLSVVFDNSKNLILRN